MRCPGCGRWMAFDDGEYYCDNEDYFCEFFLRRWDPDNRSPVRPNYPGRM